MKKKLSIILLIIFLYPSISHAYNFNDSSIDPEIQELLSEVSLSWPNDLDDSRVAVIKKAATLQKKGVLYGASEDTSDMPSQLDCSDYVAWSFNKAGVSDVDRGWCTGDFVSSNKFTQINESELIPGDVGLKSSSTICDNNNHIALYIGKKKNGNNIWFHSSTTATQGSGPQIRYGNGTLTYFLRYNNWENAETSEQITNGLTEDPAKELPGLAGGDITCETIFFTADGEEKELKKLLDGVFLIIKIAAPTIAIALSILDYIKAIAADAGAVKKTNIKTIKRMAIAIGIVFLPYLLDLLFHLFGLYDISRCNIGG